MAIDKTNLTVRNGEKLAGMDVEIDGQWFENCDLKGARLIYRGEGTFGVAPSSDAEGATIHFLDRAEVVLYHFARSFNDDQIADQVAGYRERRPDVH